MIGKVLQALHLFKASLLLNSAADGYVDYWHACPSTSGVSISTSWSAAPERNSCDLGFRNSPMLDLQTLIPKDIACGIPHEIFYLEVDISNIEHEKD